MKVTVVGDGVMNMKSRLFDAALDEAWRREFYLPVLI